MMKHLPLHSLFHTSLVCLLSNSTCIAYSTIFYKFVGWFSRKHTTHFTTPYLLCAAFATSHLCVCLQRDVWLISLHLIFVLVLLPFTCVLFSRRRMAHFTTLPYSTWPHMIRIFRVDVLFLWTPLTIKQWSPGWVSSSIVQFVFVASCLFNMTGWLGSKH